MLTQSRLCQQNCDPPPFRFTKTVKYAWLMGGRSLLTAIGVDSRAVGPYDSAVWPEADRSGSGNKDAGMLRRFRIPLIVVGTLLLLLAGGGVWFWLAVRHVPHFYVDALAVDPVELKQDSDKMVRRTAALSNDVRKEGHWDAVFTADQINGWLAVDREENHPQLIPHEFHDPRVAIHDGQMIVGCRYEGRQMNTVLSLTADVYLQSPNVVAVRIERARAGAVPLPLKDVTGQLVAACEKLGCKVELREIGADPLLLLTLPLPTNSGRDGTIRVETVELREGEIHLAGETVRSGHTRHVGP